MNHRLHSIYQCMVVDLVMHSQISNMKSIFAERCATAHTRFMRNSVRVKLLFVGRWCGPHRSLPDHVSVLGILYHNFCLPRQFFGSYWNIKMFQMLNPFIADLHHLQKSEAGNSLVYSNSHKIVYSNYLWLLSKLRLLCNTSNIFALFRTLKKNDIQNPFNSKGVRSGIYEPFSETQTESQVSAFTHLNHLCFRCIPDV